MQANTLNRLLEINHQFYQSFGADFSATRGRIQPGVRSLLNRLGGRENILDLGCGNGELARQLIQTGYQGSYTGLDFSTPLLEAAGKQTDRPQIGWSKITFLQRDLTGPDWDATLPDQGYDLVFAFAALHHIPGKELRLQILKKIARLLKKQGLFFHSNWQFLNSPRLKSRVQPWQTAGLEPEELDPGDYLLDWRHGGNGLRYVHLFNEAELFDLAEAAGFKVRETFHSDGEGGRLGLYQIWEIK
jgi:tRNA (uracil-5-)-methyltransferase TRM9